MNRWQLSGDKIIWRTAENDPHTDYIEMSGKQLSAIVTYGVDETGALVLRRDLYYPLLRTRPNNTHAHSHQAYDGTFGLRISIDGEVIAEKPAEFALDGVVTIRSADGAGRLRITRHLFPSTDQMLYIEHAVIQNISPDEIHVEVAPVDDTRFGRGVKGVYVFGAKCGGVCGAIPPGGSVTADLIFTGRMTHDEETAAYPCKELSKRKTFVSRIFNESLVLETANPQLDLAFAFAKLRACESIFDNECGLLHSPGGGRYYAAVWANDQAEYQGPFAPFTGMDDVNRAAINAYSLYVPFMGEDYRAIPSSIIAEGRDFWEGAGDRGDAAMVLYGLSRFLLAYGDKKMAAEFFPAIVWCAKYCQRRLNEHGVVASDSDELEGRFPSGDANLCTSSLAYGGLVSAANIAKELGHDAESEEFTRAAEKLRGSIERYFGANVSGYDTYRYYEGNDVLRAWICIPLTVGIHERSVETRRALFSDRLWSENGIVTQEGDAAFWDRATLYALRGLLNAGESEEACHYLAKYTQTRLLGKHVPYPVEASGEADHQRHLSAESALYCRVVTEGIAGITPTGFGRFTLRPSFPEALGVVKLKSIKAFNSDFDLEMERADGSYHITLWLRDGLEREYICGVNEKVAVVL